MTSQFTYQFEELELIVDNVEIALVDGAAVISYYDDGEWFIDSMSLDSVNGEEPAAELDNPRSEIFLALIDRLESGKWADKIAERVREELADEGVSSSGDREHSTHYMAYSGV